MTDGTVDRQPVKGEETATGEQKETFGTGSAAQSEAGKKGGPIGGNATAAQGHDAAVKRGIKSAITQGNNVNVDVSPQMKKELKNEGYELPKNS